MPRKTPEERAEQRRQGQARQSKDRARHEDGRGKKKVTLADLSKLKPTEQQIEAYHELVSAESDRGAAIMASAWTETALEVAIACRLTDYGEQATKTWFEGDNAPLARFASKIHLGQALGIYGPVTQSQLSIIKNVRNAFAHCSVPLDFTHPAVIAALEPLIKEVPLPKTDSPWKVRYCAMCLVLAKKLIQDAFKQGGKAIEVELP